MKILFLAPKYPYPPRSGSALFASRYLEYLSKSHKVDLVSFDTDVVAIKSRQLQLISGQLLGIATLDRRRIMVNAMFGLLSGQPLPVTHYTSQESQAKISQILKNGNYDVAIYQLLEMGQFLPNTTRSANILSMEDPLSLKTERWIPFIKSKTYRLRARLEVRRLRKYERLKTPLFDKTVLINRADAEDFGQLVPGAKINWAPYGVDTSYFSPDLSIQRVPGMIVISGTMSHPPNVEAVLHFCKNVFPLVKSQNSNARLHLVGANPTPQIRSLASNDILVAGSVLDMRKYLRQAMVSVCAVRLKIGTQTKVLEAMACGTPVVTTSAGNNGVEAISGQHAFVADSPADMADKINQLLTQNNWMQISENGRQFAVQCFDWSVSCAKFENIVLETAALKQARLSII